MTSEKRHKLNPVLRQRARELRQPLTEAEQRLWYHLRRKQLDGYYFRRQHPIGRFIVDFYCAQVRLVIEVDGDVHTGQPDYDKARTEWLEDRNYHVIRFTNREVLTETTAVLGRILEVCQTLNTN
jgi:very-short-patch-repair endonuclease